MEESIPKAEEWGKIASFWKTCILKRKHTFIFLIQALTQIIPDAFKEFVKAHCSFPTHQPRHVENSNILIATTPEALVGPCPKHEKEEKSEISLQVGQEW